MEHGNTIEVRKISEWNRLLNVKTKDIFKRLLGIVEGILNLEAGTAIRSGVEMLEGIVSEKNDDLPRRAYVLVYAAIRQSLLQLVWDNSDLFQRYCGKPYEAVAFDAFVKKLEKSVDEEELKIDYRFFSHPDQFPLAELIRPILQEWMTGQGIPKEVANPVGARIKFYFVRKLNEIWKSKEDYFKPLEENLEDRFQLDRVRGRYNYNQSLIEKWSERMFDEAFGLDAIYVPLNGCYLLPFKDDAKEKQKHLVVDAEQHIWEWLHDPNSEFKTLVLRGGPGSGKSSLMKKLAMRLAEESERPVYFVHLQWFNFKAGFDAGIRSFIEKSPMLSLDENPFDKNAIGDARKPIFIFDGLDELSRAGGLGKAIASEFITQLKSSFADYNRWESWDLRAIVTGRDFVVQQAAEHTHKSTGQVVELVPYFFPKHRYIIDSKDEDWSNYSFHDPKGLTRKDLRRQWWASYWKAKGEKKKFIPKELDKPAYLNLSCQPLLSYLLARAYSDGLIDENTEANVNYVYERLIDSLRERKWGGKDGWQPTVLTKAPFFQLLGELAITAWHTGDVRVTNLKAFEDRCQRLKLDHLIKGFDESNDANATNLVISIFAKGKGKNEDGVDIIEFTHKSFGEYLVARKLVVLAQEVAEEYTGGKARSQGNAMQDWLDVCSQEEITEYIWPFLERQVTIDYKEKVEEAGKIQKALSDLFSDLINTGFVPNKDLKSNLEIISASRNAESSLLLTISAFARVSMNKTFLKWRDAGHPKRVLSRIMLWSRGLFSKGLFGVQFPLAVDLIGIDLALGDLRHADLRGARLYGSDLQHAELGKASLIAARLQRADLFGADLADADLFRANLEEARLIFANIESANLQSANLEASTIYPFRLESTGMEMNGKEAYDYLISQGALNVPKPEGME